MKDLQDRLTILTGAYDRIADTYNNEAVNTHVEHIKNSINELGETLSLLNNLFNKEVNIHETI